MPGERAQAFVTFAKADPLLPDVKEWSDLRDYLKARRVGREAIKNALYVWREYEAQTNA